MLVLILAENLVILRSYTLIEILLVSIEWNSEDPFDFFIIKPS